MPQNYQTCHLLWAFLLMKNYVNVPALTTLSGSKVCEKTYAKWAWIFIEAIADLGPKVVSADDNDYRYMHHTT
jgi:hypothetical protein